jgi:uncharacterized repeat protein (TIGR02543 family)
MLSLSLLATLLVGISVTTIAPAQAVATCAEGGACALGDTGPGGGKVFYVSTSTFTCGPTLNLSCRYLEAAPNAWAGGIADPSALFSGNLTTRIGGAVSKEIGTGYKNTLAIVAQSDTAERAATKSRAYLGGGKSDWYLPSRDELKALVLGKSYVGIFRWKTTGGNFYWSSTQSADYASAVWGIYVTETDNPNNGFEFEVGKDASGYVSNTTIRPIRAFDIAVEKINQATLTVNSASGTFGRPVMLASAGGSGSGAVTYATTSANCSISGGTLSVTAVATCAVVATKAADASYNAATSASLDIVFAKALPSVTLQYPNSNTVTYSLGETLSATSFSRSGSGAITFSTTSSACSIDSSTAVISILTAGICDAYINVVEAGNYTARSSYTRVTITALTGLTATFDTPTATSDGFTVNLTNYGSDYSFVATVDTGTVIAGIASGGILPLVVSGLTPGESATVTVVTTRIGYENVSTTVSTRAIANKSVTFKPNFTASPPSDTSQSSNSAVSLLGNAFTRANFTFTGWNTEADGTGTPFANGASYGFASDVSLFAQWVQNSLYGITPSDLTLVGTLTAAGINSRFEGSTGGSTVAVQYETGSLPTGTVINIHLLSSTVRAASLITSTSNFILSFVVSWLAPDGTVPLTESGTALSMTITNSLIKKGASVYSVIGSTATRVGTATADGVVTIAITEDPEIVIAIGRPDAPTGVNARDGENSVSTVTWSAPVSNGGSSITSYLVTSSGGQSCSPGSLATLSCVVRGLTNGTDYTFTVTASNSAGISESSTATSVIRPLAPVVTPTIARSAPSPRVDPAIAIAAQAEKERAAEEQLKIVAIKAAEEVAALKIAEDKVRENLRIQKEKLLEEEKVIAELQKSAELKAADEIAQAALAGTVRTTPLISLFSISANYKLSVYDRAYLTRYISELKAGATVTCVGYIYSKGSTYAKAKSRALTQANAVCSMIKKEKKSLSTKIAIYPATKAPKAAVGAKWVAVSFRVDSFKKQ